MKFKDDEDRNGDLENDFLRREIDNLRRENHELKSKFMQAKNLYADYAETNIKYIFYHNQFKKHPIYRFDRWLRSLEGLFPGQRPKELINTEVDSNAAYLSWINSYDTISSEDRSKIAKVIKELHSSTEFAIYVFADGNEIDFKNKLSETISSIESQLYPSREVVILFSSGDGGPSIDDYANRENIRVIATDQVGIENAELLSIINENKNDYALFMVAGDQLSEAALFEFGHEINLSTNKLFIYSDEDQISKKGERCCPIFKPDWNETLFLVQNYINRAVILKTNLLAETLRSFDQRANIDLEKILFRAATSILAENISHIPSILFHFRYEPSSLSFNDLMRSKDEVERYLSQRNVSATVERNTYNDGWLHIRRSFEKDYKPLVSIIIPTRNNPELFSACVNGILANTNYKNIELIIVDHINDDPKARSIISSYSNIEKIKTVFYDKPFNYSDMNNEAAKCASGDILLLMNDDVEVLHADWLDEIVGRFSDEDCGVVGAKLLFSNRTIQHAGIIVGYGGVAGHPQSGMNENEQGYCGRLVVASELSAVTGACLAIRKQLYDQLGGMDDAKFRKKFNDVDLCLKVRGLGYKIIWTPHAVLLHHESSSLGIDENQEQFASLMQETRDMLLNWPVILADPYYNPNLSIVAPGYDLAFPPRRVRPWEL